MAFSDPQSITIGANTTSLPRTGSSDSSGVFQSADGNIQLRISHSYTSTRVRHLIRVDTKKVAPDPLFPAQNTPYKEACYLVVDEPLTGYTVTEQTDMVKGLINLLSASTFAALTKLIGGES
jgi:hypothetical protein